MLTGVIIQARLTSQRFPGKVMAMLGGKTVLERVVERCKLVPFIDGVIVAFPNNTPDKGETLRNECYRLGVTAFASPHEHDVQQRYYECASYHQLTKVMRVTADCPFLNPLLAGEVIWQLRRLEADYASNCYPSRTYPKGLDVEVFTYAMLSQAATSPYDREHVTPWIQQNAPKKLNLTQDEDCSHVNWCVDYPGDISRLEPLVEHQDREVKKFEGLIEQIIARRPNVRTY